MSFIKKLKKIFGIDEEPVEESKPEAEADAAEPEKRSSKINRPVSSLPPAPEKREEIVRFIIHSLRPYMDEKSNTIAGLQFYILCENNEEEELAKVALYAGTPDKFKQEELHRKLTDNFIHLPDNWFFEFNIVRDKLPECRFKKDFFALEIVDLMQKGSNFPTARLLPLEGQTSESEYLLNPNQKQKYFIGRGKNPILESGRTHTNDIVFLDKDDAEFDETKGASNLFISRNHAFIAYNPYQRKYFLYVDKGGLPSSGNKTKILKAGEGDRIVRVDILGAAHELSDGDQIELGGEAKLLFLM
jgi:hypothetical protein